MKKSLGIGIGLAVIVTLVIVYSSFTNEQDLAIVDQLNKDQSKSNEEEIAVVKPQTSGREISVEFAESVELESP